MPRDVLSSAGKLLYHLCIDRPTRWYPILGVYYLTYRCSFRCPYCSDGAANPYYRLKEQAPDAEQAIHLLRCMRRFCEHVVLTGGEPLCHEEVRDILRRLPDLSFESTIFTTNGYDLDAYLDQVAKGISQLVISLDTLDELKADAWNGVGKGSFRRILSNLERAGRLRARSYEIVISSVVTPDNIEDLYDVFEYADWYGYRFAACPQLVGVKAHRDLQGNDTYRRFYDHLIKKKKRGCNIEGTVEYLTAMRDLSYFKCHPFTMLVVSPLGNVFYPCLELGHHPANLRDVMSLHDLRRKAEETFGPQPTCDTRCHSACALGFATVLNQPRVMVREGYYQAKGLPRQWLDRVGRVVGG